MIKHCCNWFLAAICVTGIAMPTAAQDTRAAKDEASPSGTWTWEREGVEGPMKCVLTVKEENGKVTGKFKDDMFDVELAEGTFEDGKLTVSMNLELDGQEIAVTLSGQVSDDAIEGIVVVDMGDGEQEIEWMADRVVGLSDVAGKWQMRFTTPDGIEMTPEFELKEDDGKPKLEFVDGEGMDVSKTKFNEGLLTFEIDMEYDGQPLLVEYELKLEGDKLTGVLHYFFKEMDEEGDLEIDGKRIK